MRNFIITENQLSLLLNFLNPISKGNIHEVVKDENFNEGTPVYRYKEVKVKPMDFRPNEIGTVFFNGPVFGKTEYKIPDRDRDVIFKGPQGEFRIHSSLIDSKGNSPYILGYKLSPNSRLYNQLYDLMPVSDDVFSSSDVRNALKMAFGGTKFWRPDTDEFSEGLRGIHTIGEKTGNDYEDWSIMNYFDTKDSVKSLLNKRWKKEEEEWSGDKIEWLSEIFKKNDDFLKKLLDIQWESIKSGMKTESNTMKNIKDFFNKKGISVEFETYPPGHKTDRWSGIDFTIILENGKRFTIQVKPLTKFEETFNNKIKVHTYGMKNSYKTNPKLDFIVYNAGPNFFFFRNSNYEVSKDGRTVIHNDPFIYDISDLK
jgi:hypothetical protein